MKNKLTDLNNHLFEQLERLNDDDLQGDKLKVEIDRAKAMSGIARDIISNGSLVLKVQQAFWDRNVVKEDVPEMLTDGRRS